MTTTDKKKVYNPRDGWKDGKAAPELLREDLRALPGSYVTKDTSDPDKIHELDFPHIVESLIDEQRKKEIEANMPMRDPEIVLGRAPIGKVVPLKQELIDVERFMAINGIVKRQLREIEAGERIEPDFNVIYHLWFPDNNVNKYFLRKGAPPPDVERPKHLRGFDLVVNILEFPDSVKDKMCAAGLDAYYFTGKLLKTTKDKYSHIIH